MSTEHQVLERIGHAVTRQAQPALTPNVATLSGAGVFSLTATQVFSQPLVTLSLALTAIIRPDDGHFSAYCPELDVITARPTTQEALDDLADMIEGYAEVYARDWETRYRFSRFASHRPFIQAVRSLGAAMPVCQMFNVVMLDAGVV